jgi:hypothetical protein
MKLSIVLKIFQFFMTISMLMWMTVYAHLGDTEVDVNGCHTNSSTGESHCHDSDSSSDGVSSDTSSSDSSSTSSSSDTSSSDSSSASSPTSSLTNNPLYTNGYSKGFAEGKTLCQKSPRACGLSLNAPAGSRSEEDIKAECRIDPASCGIETGNYDDSAEAYIAQGIAQCQTDPQCCEGNTTCSTQACTDICQTSPSDCGINITGTLEEGIQQCQNDPSSCGITQNAEGELETGIQQCQNDPSSCGIIVSNSVNDAVQEIKAQCQKNPAICGIEVNGSTSTSDDSCTSVFVHGSFSLNDGKLFLPAVDVPTAFDGTVTTFEIEMEIISGREPLSFTIINAVPVEK